MYQYITEEFLKELGLDKLPEEEKQRIMLQLMDVFTKRVMLKLIKNLDDNKLTEFDKFLETDPDPVSIFSYLADNVSNFDSIIEEEAKAFRQEAIDFIKSS